MLERILCNPGTYIFASFALALVRRAMRRRRELKEYREYHLIKLSLD